jgi:hypothetical protein
MNEEDKGVEWLARQAWVNYNPKWLLNKADKVADEGDFIYDVVEVRDAYMAGFEAGLIFKITKKIPEVNE